MKKILMIMGGIALTGLMLFIMRLVFLGAVVNVASDAVKSSFQEMQQQNIERTQKQIEEIKNRTAHTASENQKKQALAQLQTKQETKLLSYECQFWTQQNELNPTDRAAEKKKKYCGI